MSATASYMCVWLGTPGECQNCGGSTTSLADDGTPGPFPGDDRFCSEECYVDHLTFVERDRRWRETDYCPSCGFDNHEHDEGCKIAGREGIATDIGTSPGQQTDGTATAPTDSHDQADASPHGPKG